MEEKRNKKYSSSLVLLVVVLIIVICIQTFYTIRLHGKIDKAIGPTTSVSVTTPPSLLGQPFLQSPGWFSGSTLDPNNNFLADPFSEMKGLHQQMNQMFNDSFFRLGGGKSLGTSPNLLGRTVAPRFDIDDKGDHFIVKMDVPGVEKSSINVEIKDRILTVSANRSESQEEKNAKGNILRRERYIGNFRRSVTLPSNVKADSVEAKYKNGVLTITIPKAEQQEQQSHRIEIK